MKKAQDYIDTNNCKPGKAFNEWGSYNKYGSRYKKGIEGFESQARREEYEAFMIKNKKYYPDFEIVELD